MLDSTHNITGVDLLLTSQWPQDVHLYAADIVRGGVEVDVVCGGVEVDVVCGGVEIDVVCGGVEVVVMLSYMHIIFYFLSLFSK